MLLPDINMIITESHRLKKVNPSVFLGSLHTNKVISVRWHLSYVSP